jgi:hypothetical protein
LAPAGWLVLWGVPFCFALGTNQLSGALPCRSTEAVGVLRGGNKGLINQLEVLRSFASIPTRSTAPPGSGVEPSCCVLDGAVFLQGQVVAYKNLTKCTLPGGLQTRVTHATVVDPEKPDEEGQCIFLSPMLGVGLFVVVALNCFARAGLPPL